MLTDKNFPKNAAVILETALPASEGWNIRQYDAREPWRLDVQLPEPHGGITLNLRDRCWAPGGGNGGRSERGHWFGVAGQAPYVQYKGRDWLLRMCQDIRKAVARLMIDCDRPSYRGDRFRKIPAPEWAYTACGDEWLRLWKLLWGSPENPEMLLILEAGPTVPALTVRVHSVSEGFWGAMVEEFDSFQRATISITVDGANVVLMVAHKDSRKDGAPVWAMDYIHPGYPKGVSYDYMGKSGDQILRPDHWQNNGVSGMSW